MIHCGNILTIFATGLLLFSCGEAEKEGKAKPDTIDYSAFGMRSPEPVIVDVPLAVPLQIDTAFYVFHIMKDKIVLEHGAKEIKVVTMNQFDSLVKENKSAMEKTRIALKADSLAYKRIDSAVQIFKDNNIFQFNLITDLDIK